MKTNPTRPKKRNWKNAIKPVYDPMKIMNRLFYSKPYWVKSYNQSDKGHWTARFDSKQDMMMKFKEDVDSKKFGMVKMGFDTQKLSKFRKFPEIDVSRHRIGCYCEEFLDKWMWGNPRSRRKNVLTLVEVYGSMFVQFDERKYEI